MKVELVALDIMGEDNLYYSLEEYLTNVIYTMKQKSEFPIIVSSPNIHSIYTDDFTLQLNSVPPIKEIYNEITFNFD